MDEQYYIEQLLIPPLTRVFDHIGADVRQWYKNMPKIRRADALSDYDHHDPMEHKVLNSGQINTKAKFAIDSHFRKTGCASCGKPTENGRESFRLVRSVLSNN